MNSYDSMSEDAYKKAKEDFVSGHSGTTMLEIAAVNLLLPFSYLTAVLLSTRFGFDSSRGLPGVLYGLFTVIGPVLISFTLTEYTIYIVAFQTFILLALHLESKKDVFSLTIKGNKRLKALNSKKKPFLTVYRAGMMMCTCLAILAVDFHIFPRRFCKCETFGISLMDAGVGCFVVSAGLVSRQIRSNRSVIKRVFSSSAPMIVLGIYRYVTTKHVNYQLHVSEYGLHWNFFFTLAVVAMLAAVVNIEVEHSAITAAFIICVYQLFLTFGGISEYILNAPRINFFSSNKEGIFSCLGYFSLYLFGLFIGSKLSKNRTKDQWRTVFIQLLTISFIFLVAAHFSNIYIEEISRRMANLSYVLWIVGLNLLVLGECLGIFVFFNLSSSNNALFDAVNFNQLGVFAVANVLTGVINVSYRTLGASSLQALGVLTAYMTAISIFAFFLARRNFKIKRW